MNTRVITGLALLGCSVGGLISAAPAHAQFLVGAEILAANSTGATVNQAYSEDTNSSNGDGTLFINGNGKGLSLPLTTGSNAFTFSQALNNAQLSAQGATNGTLGLFFSSTNTSYNPSTTSRTPDLVISATANGGTSFFAPAAGVLVDNFVYNQTLLPANGLTSITVGSSVISISAYSVTNTPTGTFTVNVSTLPTATPEPGSIALLSGLGLSGGVFALRRRRRK
jgi:hypothetical protein